MLTVLPKVHHCEGFSPWQSIVAPGCHSEQSEESPTRLYAVNVLSLVGFEEILHYVQNDRLQPLFCLFCPLCPLTATTQKSLLEPMPEETTIKLNTSFATSSCQAFLSYLEQFRPPVVPLCDTTLLLCQYFLSRQSHIDSKRLTLIGPLHLLAPPPCATTLRPLYSLVARHNHSHSNSQNYIEL